MYNERKKKGSADTASRLRLTTFFYIALAFAVLALIIHILCMRVSALADFFACYASPLIRKTLGFVTALFPFSLAEAVVITSPAWLVLLIRLARRVAKNARSAAKMLSALLSVPLLLYSLFVFSFAVGYYVTPLGERLSLVEEDPNAENLYALASHLAERADACAEEAGVAVKTEGSIMPFSYAEMNGKLISAYDTVEEKYGIFSNFAVGTKPIALSEPMAYTHITGVYTFMTGEMNVCTAFPDCSTVFTAAHEMAHARGIAREDEANFIAFLVCEASSDPYVRYAGYVNLLQYVLNALYDTDPALYKSVWQDCSPIVIAEIRAYNTAVRHYSGTFASEVAGSINNAYLESMGTGGSVSYDLVVQLAVRYLKTKK